MCVKFINNYVGEFDLLPHVNEIAPQLPSDIEVLRALVMTACTERDAAISERDRALSQIDRLRHFCANRNARNPAGGRRALSGAAASGTGGY